MIAQADQEVRTCPTCGVVYSAPARFFQQRRDNGGSWFCPNGHSLQFTQTETDKLRLERDRLKQRVAYESDRAATAEAEAEHARHVANGHKGYAVKLKKRAGAGVCPCCNRTFSALARHMAQQHPGFAAEAVAP